MSGTGNTSYNKTITPRTFCTRRVVSAVSEYEKLANLIKLYGCIVSKVSDLIDKDGDVLSVLYFEIPIDQKEAFLREEKIT